MTPCPVVAGDGFSGPHGTHLPSFSGWKARHRACGAENGSLEASAVAEGRVVVNDGLEMSPLFCYCSAILSVGVVVAGLLRRLAASEERGGSSVLGFTGGWWAPGHCSSICPNASVDLPALHGDQRGIVAHIAIHDGDVDVDGLHPLQDQRTDPPLH